jgi:hypothetical protein
MKMVETVSEPASFLKKEVRRIVFTEITKDDLPELFNTLDNLYSGRKNCKLWVCVGRFDNWFNDTRQLSQFLHGFMIAMETIDPGFFDHFGQARVY